MRARRRRASVVLVREASPVSTVDQPSTDKHKPSHASGTCQFSKALRPESVDSIRLLGSSSREEQGRAVYDSLDAVHGRVQRAMVDHIATHNFYLIRAQLTSTTGLAHERADLVAPKGEAFGEATSNPSGRSCD